VAMHAQLADAAIRQLNAFSAARPVASGDGSRRPMDLTINTGDAADSQQLNETLWVRTLLEGGELDPGSGTRPATSGDLLCQSLAALGMIADDDAPHRYTGVQDYDDYLATPLTTYYDPDQPAGAYAGWPAYPGLMDRAQSPFEAAGVAVPSYVTFGNHDALVQGNAAANAAFEAVATGCLKPLLPVGADVDNLAEALGNVSLESLLGVLANDPTKLMFVPPDPGRRFVSKLQYKQIFRSASQDDGHGFGHVDPGEEGASGGAAGYYSWIPVAGVRMISLDTVSEGGVIGESSSGNIDAPQFRWLRSELAEATDADELVILFSHHGIPSLTADIPDEVAPPCLGIGDGHGHDLNPGCDLDPRSSTPIRLGADMIALLRQHPHAIAWVAGHSHVNQVDPFPHPSGEGGFWSIRVAAEADWPQQSRLLEVFDNDDGTLSIFGTILDHVGPATAPAAGDASQLDAAELASVARTLAYNDHQYGGRCGSGSCGEGHREDRNVELLVSDPRRGDGGAEHPPPLRLRATIDRPQRSLRRVRARVTCEGSACSARARGRLRVQLGGRVRAYPLLPASSDVAEGETEALAPAIGPGARSAARQALRRGGSVQARLRIRARGEETVRERVRRVRIVR